MSISSAHRLDSSSSLEQIEPPSELPDDDENGEEVRIFNTKELVPLDVKCDARIEAERNSNGFALSVAAYAMLSDQWLVDQITPLIECPTVIFGDLKRDNCQDDFCYCGCPGEYTIGDQVVSPQTNSVVLAYGKLVNELGKIVITRIDLRIEGEPRCFPLGHEENFGSQLWKR